MKRIYEVLKSDKPYPALYVSPSGRAYLIKIFPDPHEEENGKIYVFGAEFYGELPPEEEMPFVSFWLEKEKFEYEVDVPFEVGKPMQTGRIILF